jgi:hypothetical protein
MTIHRNIFTGIAFSLLIFCRFSEPALAQSNSWTNPVSGNWQDSFWSLGVLPGTNQSISFTNAGWKALAIGSGTSQNVPQTLNVSSITVSSPTNSCNTLLLNFAGLQTPLTVSNSTNAGAFVLSSNSVVLMLSSVLQVQNSFLGTPDQESHGAFSIGGTFNEGESSEVAAGFLRVGDIGPGTYNLTNSLLSAGYETISGAGLFKQQGGTNLPGILNLQNGGGYDLYSGELNGTLQVEQGSALNFYGGEIDGTVEIQGGTLDQQGGQMNAPVSINDFGSYNISGGNANGGITLPSDDESGGSVVQTGGTNEPGSLRVGFGIGLGAGFGDYTLSNGVLITSQTTVNPWGNFQQSGGIHSIGGALDVIGAMGMENSPVFASYGLSGGLLTASSLTATLCQFTQSGGTNEISGGVLVGASQPGSIYTLNNGTLMEANMTVQQSFNGGFIQNGGVHFIGNVLAVSGTAAGFKGYVLNGGALTVSNILISAGAMFRQSGGNLAQSGLLTLANGQWEAAAGKQQLGALELGVSGGTNSILPMPAGACILRFGDSSALVWSNQAVLVVQNWSGSILGGGNQQIIFGASSSALTAQQVSQIRFQNPAGLSGSFPAQILANGEIIPSPVLNAAPTAGKLVLRWTGGAVLQTATNAAGPYEDVGGCTNCYTNLFTDSQRFFRLRQ